MAKSDPASSKKERNKTIRWVITIFITTMLISGTISVASDALMSGSGLGVAFLVLLTIVLVGIIFDVIGVAVTSADEKPFHSMAARKVSGAQESIRLLRNAERVSSICNDVIGDICGVVSGTASATISAQLVALQGFDAPSSVISLVMSALVAGFTVGGKAIGKTFAINSCTKIVSFTGKVISWIKHPFAKKKK
ncbi:MAG: hypothetical protein IJN53_07150 [Oscillospiraceae bacterium]|nr:hypothetical protein [Oscillospiraceae bacterium]